MSRLVIFELLHPEVVRLLESWGHRGLALEVERRGESHEVYSFLDDAFSKLYAEYGGVNCRWLRQAIEENWDKVTRVVLPNLLRQYLSLKTSTAGRRVEKGAEAWQWSLT